MTKSQNGWTTFLCMIFSLLAFQIHAQDFAGTLAIAEETASLGNFIDAERHWLRAIHFSTNENRFVPSFGLGEALLGQNRYREAALQFDFAADIAPDDSLRALCLLRESAALLQIADFEFLQNRLEYLGFQKSELLEKQRQFYLANAQFGLGNPKAAEIHFQNCTANAFTKSKIADAFQEEVGLFDQKRGKAIVASLLLPGSGQVLASETKNGIRDFAIVGGLAAFGAFSITSIGLLPAVILVAPVIFPFYIGSSVRAGKSYKHKLAHQKQALLNEVYNALEVKIDMGKVTFSQLN